MNRVRMIFSAMSFAALGTVAACDFDWNTSAVVFPVDGGVKIPIADGQYEFNCAGIDKGKIDPEPPFHATIVHSTVNQKHVYKIGGDESPYDRSMEISFQHVRGSVYVAVLLRPDSDQQSGERILFMKIEPLYYGILEFPAETIQKIADQNHVKVSEGSFGNNDLDGAPEDQKAFILALAKQDSDLYKSVSECKLDPVK